MKEKSYNEVVTAVEDKKENVIDVTREMARIAELEKQNRQLQAHVERTSRGEPERTYSMKTWVWRLCKTYGDKHGIPKEVWYPIVMLEIGGNITTTTVTKREDSRGLLQINTRVHKVDKTKVYDPEYNLDYQMPELAKKYREAKAKGMKGLEVVYYVERYGQRCEWTENVKKILKKYFEEVMGQ
jgi:hypothetical protein